MNGTSFLLLLVFLVAGYVLHPLALPKLQDSGYGVIKTESGVPEKKSMTDKVANSDNSDDSAKPVIPEPKEVRPRIIDEPVEPENTNESNADDTNSMSVVDPKPKPKPQLAADPKPAPEPTPAATFTGAQAIAAMQSSIQSGSVSEFQFSQVKEWKFKGEETINGETYQVGAASYTANTLFGEQTHVAKALFKEGKLVKWVWAVNNFEMK